MFLGEGLFCLWRIEPLFWEVNTLNAERFMSSQYYLPIFALLAFRNYSRQHITSVSFVSIFLSQISNLGAGEMA